MGTRTNKTTTQRKKSFPTVERRKRLWCFTDLFANKAGKLSEPLFWSNVGKFSALFWFSWKCAHGTDTIELWILVMAVLTAHAAFTKWIERNEPLRDSSNSRSTR